MVSMVANNAVALMMPGNQKSLIGLSWQPHQRGNATK
jgi:hypothetical protein